ncbi:WhiB family transcriptional regulator [Bailinhaonella thermotolerans]|uniref:4Fe-4S Wbl-type domain-containing protein n=1 Tax=Bailinhaonella thermotolerans TaxID=1070861 RepID=A0A3A4A1L4_9ACTN|nr:WhiB family transcriptional regulator [Bailinhaonella thermotolerans]RJL21236.1 hypothetical protein D5H75_37860 [Bailinhaonella thermotolerans]
MASELLADENIAWLPRRACRRLSGADIVRFFVDAGQAIAPEDEAMCRACPVREECLTRAYAQGLESGYFGGMSPGQRSRMTLREALDHIRAEPAENDDAPDDAAPDATAPDATARGEAAPGEGAELAARPRPGRSRSSRAG